ncbi:hypothetical protein [Corynebacterium belfantii]|uniref:Transposase n=1 Tax=Corynebacterium belfantii TaxID=2014537 RepID=A0ABS0LF57_9CORY|nr:hypothetical protein [Corynebacterium belfantii]MBG9347664.1 hypothetical protein [Corynebacterium belfantii]MBG9354827.1 hypothetical protein [Corynebacterium belfantii]
MTSVARRDPADKAKIDAIEKKLLANPDIAKLESVRLFVCGGLGLQVVRESVGVSHG